MRSEVRDAVIPSQAPQKSHRMTPNLMRRAMLAIAVAACLLVAIRWALNVTNANARQLSTSLTNLQGGLEKSPSTATPVRRLLDSQGKRRDDRSADGPILEPVEAR